MAIDTSSKIHNYMSQIWKKCRVATQGQQAVLNNIQEYFPCPIGYDTKKYDQMVRRLYWFAATGNTIKTYQGAIFRKRPQVSEWTEPQEELLNSIDGNNDIITFSTIVTNDILQTSYGAILVTHDNTDGATTKADAEKLGLRPKLVYYPAESIFYSTQTQVRLWEEYIESKSEFEEETLKQIRVLDLDKDNDGKYRERIYRKSTTDGTKWIQHGEEIYPTLSPGNYIYEIPIFYIGAVNNDIDPDTPIIEGLVNANFQHFGLYSDFREGLHWIRPFIYKTGTTTQTGVNADKNVKQVIDSNVMLYDKNPNAEFGILEFKGTGLKHDVDALQMLEYQMSMMGANMLNTPKKAAESADKARLDKSSEVSVLATVANNISAAITKATRFLFQWSSAPNEEFTFVLNTDYDTSLFDSQLMLSINKSFENKLMSQKTAIHNFKKGELLAEGTTIENEIDQINTESSDDFVNEDNLELIKSLVDDAVNDNNS